MDSSTRLRRYKSAGVGHCACSQQQAQRYTGASRSSSTGPSIPDHAVKLCVWVAPGFTVEQLPPAITGRRRVRCGYLESKAQCHRVRATSTQSAAGTMLHISPTNTRRAERSVAARQTGVRLQTRCPWECLPFADAHRLRPRFQASTAAKPPARLPVSMAQSFG